MSEQLTSLALTRLAYEIADNVPYLVTMDHGQGLWMVRHDKEWANKKPITQEDRESFHSTNIFMQLGNLARSHSIGGKFGPDFDDNPFAEQTQNVFNQTIPLLGDEFAAVKLPNQANLATIDEHYNDIFETRPRMMGEYWVKRCLALKAFYTYSYEKGKEVSHDGSHRPYFTQYHEKTATEMLQSGLEVLQLARVSIDAEA